MHLRQVCVFTNMLPLNRPEVMLSAAHEKCDAEGRLVDERSRQAIRALLEAQIVDDQAALARAYAGVVENYLSGSLGAVESLTYTRDLRAPLPLDAVQPALRGVPENVDPDRRAVMAGLLASLPR